MKVANVRLLFIRNSVREQNDWSLVMPKIIQQRSQMNLTIRLVGWSCLVQAWILCLMVVSE